jgi:hypothetical protein
LYLQKVVHSMEPHTNTDKMRVWFLGPTVQQLTSAPVFNGDSRWQPPFFSTFSDYPWKRLPALGRCNLRWSSRNLITIRGSSWCRTSYFPGQVRRWEHLSIAFRSAHFSMYYILKAGCKYSGEAGRLLLAGVSSASWHFKWNMSPSKKPCSAWPGKTGRRLIPFALAQ